MALTERFLLSLWNTLFLAPTSVLPSKLLAGLQISSQLSWARDEDSLLSVLTLPHFLSFMALTYL